MKATALIWVMLCSMAAWGAGERVPRVLKCRGYRLVFTNAPIHEIAYDLSFSDPSHFTRFFRKQTGITPQEFRARRGG